MNLSMKKPDRKKEKKRSFFVIVIILPQSSLVDFESFLEKIQREASVGTTQTELDWWLAFQIKRAGNLIRQKIRLELYVEREQQVEFVCAVGV